MSSVDDSKALFRAKLILGPLILVTFLVFAIYQIYDFIVQKPVITIDVIADEPVPIPIKDQETAVPTIFNISDRSFANRQTFGAGGVFSTNESTLYVLQPRREARFSSEKWILNIEFNPREIVELRPAETSALFYTCWVLGSRFSDRTTPLRPDSSQRDVLNLAAWPDNTEPAAAYGYITGNSLVRDVNSAIHEGTLSQVSIYGLQAYRFRYANGTSETYYGEYCATRFFLLCFDEVVIKSHEPGHALPLSTEVTRTGGYSQINPNASNFFTYSMELRLGTTQIIEYTESYRIAPTTMIGSVMAAFQLILLTGYIVLFGRGRYNPYGIVHMLVRGGTRGAAVPASNMSRAASFAAVPPTSPTTTKDPEFERLKALMKEYLDTTPVDRAVEAELIARGATRYGTGIAGTASGTAVGSKGTKKFRRSSAYYGYGEGGRRFAMMRFVSFTLLIMGCILMLLCLIAGDRIQSLGFLGVSGAGEEWIVSIWVSICGTGSWSVLFRYRVALIAD
ncbi:hypothetical protein HK102_003752 [Quaeritorhiza haematococci]|nr:hypothetical protein HK102_003752 [Quaeritorhiza haematococci]